MSDSKTLEFLKNKYLSKPKSDVRPSKTADKEEDDVISNESEFDGEEAENKFLLNKFEKIQNDLSKWLEILKLKINS